MKRLVAPSFVMAFIAACTGGRLAPSDAGVDAASCATGSITFSLRARNPTAFCIGAPSSCLVEWVTLLGPSGSEFTLDRPCLADCATCEPGACPLLCPSPVHMPSEGLDRTWGGTYYELDTCGSSDSCVRSVCASPGHYVAKMCAYPATTNPSYCAPASTATCTQVPFDWPPPEGPDGAPMHVEGDLGYPDCCPGGWPLHACTYPNGDPGLACHDPALGCASSSSCGEGCDYVVTGRCKTED